MTAPDPTPRRPSTLRRNRWLWLFGVISIPAILLGLSWYFTAPLSDHPAIPLVDQGVRTDSPKVAPEPPIVWPDTLVEGDEAKKILLESMKRTVDRLAKVEAYTSTFRRQERVAGVLGPEIVSSLKIRNHPFAIYIKYLTPKAGKEVVYAEGHHDNKVIAHNGDWTRRIIPRLAVDPDSALALADSRHPVTDAGLWNLCRKLLRFREMDIGDSDATSTLDRTTALDGRPLLRSIHAHSNPEAGRLGTSRTRRAVYLRRPEARGASDRRRLRPEQPRLRFHAVLVGDAPSKLGSWGRRRPTRLSTDPALLGSKGIASWLRWLSGAAFRAAVSPPRTRSPPLGATARSPS